MRSVVRRLLVVAAIEVMLVVLTALVDALHDYKERRRYDV
jgi:hypothetical protein